MQESRVLGNGIMGVMRYFFLIILTSIVQLTNAVDYPQLKLPQQKISFCGNNYIAWVADNDEERERGLMNFRPLKKHEAMVFIFQENNPLSFWMKNVPYDLDIAYFGKDKKLITYMTMKGTSPMMKDEMLPSYKSVKPASFAVEVAGSTLKNLKNNCKLVFE